MLKNIRLSAEHPRVSRMLCVGVTEGETFKSIKAAAPEIQGSTGKHVEVILQERLGNKREGKGDGMNTALKYFLEETDANRIHFYDADITIFGPEWISKAEEASDFGFGVVRHYFPRARTDAMITWMITRTGMALIWPKSGLSWIEQPLGGELLFERKVVEKLVADPRVMAQSDWGIDTLYTFACTQHGFKLYESYIKRGKAHSLCGKLTDLKTMLVECFSAIQSLKEEVVSEDLVHRAESPSDIKGTLAVGKLADLVILEQDLTNITPETIRDVVVEMTVVGGKVVFEAE